MSDAASDVRSPSAAAPGESPGPRRLNRIVILSPGARFLTLAAAVVLAACGGDSPAPEWGGSVRDSAGVRIVENPDAGVWTAGEAWTLEEELQIGVTDGNPELQFGIITGIDATPGGEIYVLDAQAHRVRVFDADGNLLRAFGQAGQGPGELSPGLAQAPPGLFLSGEGTLLVPDHVQPGGSPVTRMRVNPGRCSTMTSSGIPWSFALGPDGCLYLPSSSGALTLPGWREVEGGPLESPLHVLGDVMAPWRIRRPDDPP